MYRLTARMEQALRQNLEKYHALFDGGRCSGWELEELLFNQIAQNELILVWTTCPSSLARLTLCSKQQSNRS